MCEREEGRPAAEVLAGRPAGAGAVRVELPPIGQMCFVGSACSGDPESSFRALPKTAQ